MENSHLGGDARTGGLYRKAWKERIVWMKLKSQEENILASLANFIFCRYASDMLKMSSRKEELKLQTTAPEFSACLITKIVQLSSNCVSRRIRSLVLRLAVPFAKMDNDSLSMAKYQKSSK